MPSYLRDTAEPTLPDFVDADPVAENVRPFEGTLAAHSS